MVCGNLVPDHATIARFLRRHEHALSDLFGSVLALCARAGLIGSGVVPVDGTKVSGNANRDRSLGYDQIAREIIAEGIATDEAEDEIYGDARGDELPPELATPEGVERGCSASLLGTLLSGVTCLTPTGLMRTGLTSSMPIGSLIASRAARGGRAKRAASSSATVGRQPGRSCARGLIACAMAPGG